MKIGFIGVGNIGAPIARQLLQAGHALVVHDIRPEAANSLLAAGGLYAGLWTRQREAEEARRKLAEIVEEGTLRAEDAKLDPIPPPKLIAAQ